MSLLLQIAASSSAEELQSRLDLMPERFDWGYRKPSASVQLKDLDEIVNNIALHHTLWASKAEVDQFCQGEWCGFYIQLNQNTNYHLTCADVFLGEMLLCSIFLAIVDVRLSVRRLSSLITLERKELERWFFAEKYLNLCVM